jgi:predicted nuclease of predicted toxin-antitoxin system
VVPEPIRYYMDEHVPRAVSEGLRRRGVDVATTQEAGQLGADDDVQLAYATSQGRALFTQDDDFLRLAAGEITHAGIIYAPQGTSIGTMVRGLMLISEVYTDEEMVNHVEYL